MTADRRLCQVHPARSGQERTHFAPLATPHSPVSPSSLCLQVFVDDDRLCQVRRPVELRGGQAREGAGLGGAAAPNPAISAHGCEPCAAAHARAARSHPRPKRQQRGTSHAIFCLSNEILQASHAITCSKTAHQQRDALPDVLEGDDGVVQVLELAGLVTHVQLVTSWDMREGAARPLFGTLPLAPQGAHCLAPKASPPPYTAASNTPF